MNEMLLIIKLAAKPLKNPFAHIKSAAMLIFSKSSLNLMYAIKSFSVLNLI